MHRYTYDGIWNRFREGAGRIYACGQDGRHKRIGLYCRSQSGTIRRGAFSFLCKFRHLLLVCHEDHRLAELLRAGFQKSHDLHTGGRIQAAGLSLSDMEAEERTVFRRRNIGFHRPVISRDITAFSLHRLSLLSDKPAVLQPEDTICQFRRREQYEEVRSLSYVKRVGRSVSVGEAVAEEGTTFRVQVLDKYCIRPPADRPHRKQKDSAQ